jgi:predicted component of type VI protein secretion system
MATIINKRKHDLECNGVLLRPGENTVDDQVWQKANSEGSQFPTWFKLNWIGERRSLPMSKDATKAGTTFHAPSVDSPVSQEPGSDMNPSASPAGPTSSSTPTPSSSSTPTSTSTLSSSSEVAPEHKTLDSDESKRRRK